MKENRMNQRDVESPPKIWEHEGDWYLSHPVTGFPICCNTEEVAHLLWKGMMIHGRGDDRTHRWVITQWGKRYHGVCISHVASVRVERSWCGRCFHPVEDIFYSTVMDIPHRYTPCHVCFREHQVTQTAGKE